MLKTFNMTKLFTIFLIIFLLPAGCRKNPRLSKFEITDAILENKQNYFYLDTKKYPVRDKSLPIGVFDSGTGGLTVLDAIVKFDKFDNESHQFSKKGDGIRDLQAEYFIYLGDQANMPYGNYSRENKIDLLKEHIIKDVHFLMNNKYYLDKKDQTYQIDKKPVKAIVIACNTATAFGKKDIETFLNRARLDLKVLGVIDAAVRAALDVLFKSKNRVIGIMATAGTVSSNGYVKAIRSYRDIGDFPGGIKIFQQAGIGLAGAIDGSVEYISTDAEKPRKEYKGPSPNHPEAKIDLSILKRYGFDWSSNKMLYEGELKNPENIQINSVENYISYHLVSLLENIRKTGQAESLSAIILGCTHYPFYRKVFTKKLSELYNYCENGKYIYRTFMSKEIDLIDPAENVARELYNYLAVQKLLNSNDISNSEFYISVPNLINRNIKINSIGNFPYKYKYGRNAGFIQQYVKRVPFSKRSIPPDNATRIRKKIPLIFELIKGFNRNNPKMKAFPENEKF